MKAAIYYGQNDIRIETTETPSDSLAEQEVLLRPLYSGICGTDVHEFVHGPTLIPTTANEDGSVVADPQILGHEFSAEVLAVGSGAKGIRAGDLVAVRPGAWCGSCDACLSGVHMSCPEFMHLGLFDRWGGLAERAVVRAEQLTVMPDNVDAKQAALLEPTGVAYNAFSLANVPLGGSVLITGGGPIGALTALIASAAGVTELVVSEPNPQRRALLDSLGVAEVVDGSKAGALGNRTFDSAIEASGHPAGLHMAIEAIRPRGTICQVGIHTLNPMIPMIELQKKQGSIVGTWGWPVTGWERMAKLIASGRLPVEKLISAVIDFDDLVSGGILALQDPHANHQKILIRIGD